MGHQVVPFQLVSKTVRSIPLLFGACHFRSLKTLQSATRQDWA